MIRVPQIFICVLFIPEAAQPGPAASSAAAYGHKNE
jgi:hypothetical protein